jgi:nucleotide-binding universal stress UspA family protein
VFDALPLLQRAKDVTALWVDPAKDKAAAGDLPGAELCTSLARHGVRCTAVSAASDVGDVGRELLTQVKANRADLLVMGAYGHTRWREFLLGGASKHVFANMSCPVLMSH